MNRRSLLKLIGMAPVAAPVLAQSALASGGAAAYLPAYFVPGVMGEALIGEALPLEPIRQFGVSHWQGASGIMSQFDLPMQDDDCGAEFARWMPDGVEALSATR